MPGVRATVGQIAHLVGGRVIAPRGVDDATAAARVLTGVAGLADAEPDDLSFFANPKYEPQVDPTRAGAVLVGEARQPLLHAAQIVVGNASLALAQLMERFDPGAPAPSRGIHPTAVIGEGVQVGEGVRIGAYAVVGDHSVLGAGVVLHPHAVVGPDCRLGDGCVLFPHASLRERCTLGCRVILHNGVVVGSDGFGYETVDGVHRKIPQIGTVVIEDDVEIGANTTIDRARFGRTRIGAGTKIDNLVQVAHNVEIGAHGILVAQSAVAGSTRIGHHLTIAGQSGVAGHLTLGNHVTVAGRSGVGKHLPDGVVVRGTPAQAFKTQMAQEVAVRRLPQTQETVRRLEARIAELERRLAQANP